ncbi:MAG: vanadium-dependent haloperoxidase [Methylococcales bacterium]|nr:vanadium-dependent haloperoxidase [Methylococcales bacterium]
MNINRKVAAQQTRISAADLAYNRVHPLHITNGDEQKFRRVVNRKNMPSYLASFTKGMPHCEMTGLVLNPNDFQLFVKGIDSGDPRDFIDTPLGPIAGTEETPDWRSNKAKKAKAKVRAWESQGAGQTYDLEGPDSHAVTMPPAPVIGSDELIAEMGEVYAQALLRDIPFTEIVNCKGKVSCKYTAPGKTKSITVNSVLKELNQLTWFKSDNCCSLNVNEVSRKRGTLTGQTAFRGITPGDEIGPYISQFLLVGNRGVNSNDTINKRSHGFISYGAIRADQRVRYAKPCEDHMTHWDEWLDVQEGANLGGMESYENKPAYRFITTPRDMATYVHYDALYESYLNACLILLGEGIPFDPGLPFQQDDYIDHQQGFAHFGGPHVLSLLTEVATRALKAVRYQKFNTHRRLRPEALAARLTKHKCLGVSEIDTMVNALQPILNMIDAKNPQDSKLKQGNYLLPMAFCEGSPMHPSYGAGHATVAGACVTIIKAFFDHKHPLNMAGDDTTAFVPESDGSCLIKVPVVGGKLTVEGELNKLASNISTGRDWAGVHYFTDYIESLRMGEQIAIGILEEQKLTFGENFSMTVPLFDGGSMRI